MRERSSNTDEERIGLIISKLNHYVFDDNLELIQQFHPTPKMERAIEDDELQFGQQFPYDYKSFMKQFGSFSVAFWDIGLTASSSEYELLKEICPDDNRGEAEGPVKPLFFSNAWWPVGNCDQEFLFLDMDPAPGGSKGQIIHGSMDSGCRHVVADSFAGLLERIVYLFELCAVPPVNPTSMEDCLMDNFREFVITGANE